MVELTFKYTSNTTVTITVSNPQNITIWFLNNCDIFPFLELRYRPYLRVMRFRHRSFDVRCTAKDGSAFLTLYRDGYFSYGIRKKKMKKPILFFKTTGNPHKVKLEDSSTDFSYLLDNEVRKDIETINDFLQKRESKNLSEEEYLASLDEEEREEYMQSKRFDEMAEWFGKRNNLNNEQIENLAINLLFFDDNIKSQLLETDDLDLVDSIIKTRLTILLKPIECESKNWATENNDHKLIVDEKYIFSDFNFDLLWPKWNPVFLMLIAFFLTIMKKLKFI